MSTLRDAWVVASFDLGESLRSRKVLILLFLYVAGAIGSTWLFTEALQAIEQQLASQLGVAQTRTPGNLTKAIMESPELVAVLSELIRDRELATALVRVPPIALLYGWVTLTFGPIFVVLTSSDTIASEVASGSVRFALFRTHRAVWVFGKLWGQAALLALGVFFGAVAAWITGWIRLSSFAPLDTALWLARYAGTAYSFVFAYLGLALGISQLTRSVPWSRALGLFALAFMAAMHGWLAYWMRERAPVLADSLRMLFPAAHRLDLWRLEASAVLPAVTMLLALGITYLVLGYLRFARRDA